MKGLIALALVAVFVVGSVGTAQARPHYANGPAAKACKAERTADKPAFKTKYANKNGKRAFARCVRQHVRAAKKSCRAERKADKAAFKTKYANKRGKRAFLRCVRQHADDPVV